MAKLTFRRFFTCAVVSLVSTTSSVLAAPTNATNATTLEARDAPGIPVSRNTESCPGYNLSGLKESTSGLSAQLKLAGNPCTAFGRDIEDLTIEVTYDTQTRLHVKIYDTAKNQFQIPASLIEVAPPADDASPEKSDLVFNYDEQPFAFWISRKGDGKDTLPLFDTRKSSLPPTPIDPVRPDDASTRLPTFNLIFEDQYLEVTSALPKGANIYGLGEYFSASGFRRDVGETGSGGTVQALFTNGWSQELNRNSYGVNPFYMEHRLDASGKGQSHGVFLMNSNGMDVLLVTPPNSTVSLIQYRVIGGVLDFYVMAGPEPKAVIEQYSELLGKPLWTPTWAFGFHLCRWGYTDIADWKSRVTKMREANIPLEVQWVDIDFFDKYWAFTNEPSKYKWDDVKPFLAELHGNHQRMIPIIDPGIAKAPDQGYGPHDRGVDKNVFIHMTNGSITWGRVWPGDTYFPDWFAPQTQDYWTQNFQDWKNAGMDFDGIWLDMNEASNFCDGICGIHYDPGSTRRSLTIGNFTEINGTHIISRAEGDMSGRVKSGSINFPPYPIHNTAGNILTGSIDMFSLHAQGQLEYDLHNVYGLGEEKATYLALRQVLEGQRPFIISRSTFASAGRWTGHWLGDNHHDWWAMWSTIQGVLQFQMFGIPMVGADVCGHMGEPGEELCARWHELGAWLPFFRNHRTKDEWSSEPYLWDSVADATRKQLAARYSILPLWSTLFAEASLKGTPPVRALWWEFPNDASLFGTDQQFMLGSSIIVTPVLEPGATTVKGVLPGNEDTESWYDFWTHDRALGKGNTTFDAPLDHIVVHIRGGSVLLTHANPAYTTTETREGPYSLVVALDPQGKASSEYYLDDGISFPVGAHTTLKITASSGKVDLTPTGDFNVEQKLDTIEVLGAATEPKAVTLNGVAVTAADQWTYDKERQVLVLSKVDIDLNVANTVAWAADSVSTPPKCR